MPRCKIRKKCSNPNYNPISWDWPQTWKRKRQWSVSCLKCPFLSLRHKASSLWSWNSPRTCKTKAFDWLRGGKAGKREKFAFVFSSFGHTSAGPRLTSVITTTCIIWRTRVMQRWWKKWCKTPMVTKWR